ncbi:MAG: 30S ribosomal protein S24e [Candidatus Marsarchaeota archaeon]|nr:30S ribosomal protein S24e [Candidatus Marsarchaeota archaeon]
MEIKISNDKENKLFKRREISFAVVGEEKTPSAAEVKKELCKKLNISPDATLIKELYQAFGERLCEGMAVSYESAEAMQKSEQKHKIERRAKAAAKVGSGEEKKE